MANEQIRSSKRKIIPTSKKIIKKKNEKRLSFESFFSFFHFSASFF